MSLINRLVLKIYNNQLKDVDKKQKNMTFDSEIVIEENIPYKEGNGNLSILEINAGVAMDQFIQQIPMGRHIATEIYEKAILSMFDIR